MTKTAPKHTTNLPTPNDRSPDSPAIPPCPKFTSPGLGLISPKTVETPEFKTALRSHLALGLLTPSSFHINPATSPSAYRRFVSSVRHNNLYSISYRDDTVTKPTESVNKDVTSTTLQQQHIAEDPFVSSEDEISSFEDPLYNLDPSSAETHQQLIEELHRLNEIIVELIDLLHDHYLAKSHAIHRVNHPESNQFIKSLIVSSCFLLPSMVFLIDYSNGKY